MNRPFAVLGFSYLISLLVAGQFSSKISLIIAVVLLLFAILLAALFKNRRLFLVFPALAAATVSFAVCGIYVGINVEPILELSDKNFKIDGVIIEKSAPSNDMAGYILRGTIGNKSTKISLYGADMDADLGDTLHFSGTLTRFKDNANFAEEAYNYTKGILLKVKPTSAIVVEKSVGTPLISNIYSFKEHISARIGRYMQSDEGALIRAVTFGDRSLLSPELRDSMRRSGIAHFSAVSGLHLTILAHALMSLIALTPLVRFRKFRFSALSIIVMLFMAVCGFPWSAVRSGIMILVFYAGELFMRRADTLNSLGLATLIILIFSPNAAADPGLLLSISGTLGIGVVGPAVNALIKRNSLLGLREVFVSNLCASICTLPLSAIYFGGVSLISPLTNLILEPFFPVCLLFSLIFAVSGGFLAPALVVSGLAAKVIIFVANVAASFKYAFLPLEYGFLTRWFIGAAGFIIACVIWRSNVRTFVSAVTMSVAALAIVVTTGMFLTADQIKIAFYSDGTNGFAAIYYGNNCAIVATGDSQNTITEIDRFLKNHYLDSASLLCLLNSSNNNRQKFEALPATIYVPPEGDGNTYRIGKKLVFSQNGSGEADIFIENVSIHFSKLQTADKEKRFANIQILYGFMNKNYDIPSDMLVFLNRRMTAASEGERSAFFEKLELTISN